MHLLHSCTHYCHIIEHKHKQKQQCSGNTHALASSHTKCGPLKLELQQLVVVDHFLSGKYFFVVRVCCSIGLEFCGV